MCYGTPVTTEASTGCPLRASAVRPFCHRRYAVTQSRHPELVSLPRCAFRPHSSGVAHLRGMLQPWRWAPPLLRVRPGSGMTRRERRRLAGEGGRHPLSSPPVVRTTPRGCCATRRCPTRATAPESLGPPGARKPGPGVPSWRERLGDPGKAVGFKSPSHCSVAFGKAYGRTPPSMSITRHDPVLGATQVFLSAICRTQNRD